MKNILGSLSLVALFLISSCGYSTMSNSSGNKKNRETSTSKIYFEDAKYQKVLDMAEAEQKPVFLDFYTDWCAPCRWLEKDAFHNEAAAKYFNANLISLKVNAEKGEGVDLAQKFKITAYPTVIYLKPNGQEISRHIGMTTASKLVGMARKSVKLIEEENAEKETSK